MNGKRRRDDADSRGSDALLSLTVLCCLMASAMPAQAAPTACASVKIEIRQELTLERQGFDAHMRINNGFDNLGLTNVDIDVKFMVGSVGSGSFRTIRIGRALPVGAAGHAVLGAVQREMCSGRCVPDAAYGIEPARLEEHGHRAGVAKQVAVELACRLTGRLLDVEKTKRGRGKGI